MLWGHRKTIWLFGLLLLTTSWVVLAQGAATCPALVEKALQEVGGNCGGLARNSACYGFNRVDATFVETTAEDLFSKPADRAGLAQMQTIATAPLDPALERWGIAVMNVQANVPNTLPGQAVVFLLLGDVEVENAVPPQDAAGLVTPVTLTAKVNANVRSGPSLNANVVGSVRPGTPLEADGLSPDKAWLRVLYASGPAWINRQVVNVENTDTLPVISEERRSPMQAFYFSTGTGQPACNEAPPSVLVVQGPQKVAVDITANGADIRIASTILLRLLPGNIVQLIVLSGEATVDGIVVPMGFTMTAPLSDDGKSLAGPWGNLRPLNEDELILLQPLENIPVELLHYPIIVPDLEDIQAILDRLNRRTQTSTIEEDIEEEATTSSVVDQCAGFKPTSPLVRVPWEIVPFYWDPAPGADSYQLNIYDEGGGLRGSYVVPAPETTTLVNIPGLGDGPRDYTWEVIAFRSGVPICTTEKVVATRDLSPRELTDMVPPPVVPASLTVSLTCSAGANLRIAYSNATVGAGFTFSVSGAAGIFSGGFSAVSSNGSFLLAAGPFTPGPNSGSVTVSPPGTTFPVAVTC